MEGKLDKGISKVLTTMYKLKCDINSKDFDSVNEFIVQLQDDIDVLILDVIRAEDKFSVDEAEIANANKIIDKANDIKVEADEFICEVEAAQEAKIAYKANLDRCHEMTESIMKIINSDSLAQKASWKIPCKNDKFLAGFSRKIAQIH